MLLSWAKALLKSIQKTQQKRADYQILLNMSDRELKDISVGRSEIRERVYGETAN